MDRYTLLILSVLYDQASIARIFIFFLSSIQGVKASFLRKLLIPTICFWIISKRKSQLTYSNSNEMCA